MLIYVSSIVFSITVKLYITQLSMWSDIAEKVTGSSEANEDVELVSGYALWLCYSYKCKALLHLRKTRDSNEVSDILARFGRMIRPLCEFEKL